MNIFSNTVANRKYILVGFATLIVSILLYLEMSIIPTGGDGKFTILDYLFQKSLNVEIAFSTLIIYLLYKFVVTAISVTLPLPVGLFTPVILIGGVIGRIFGISLFGFKIFSYLIFFIIK